jgi:hypothetical protein
VPTRRVVDAGLEVDDQQRNNENRRPFQVNSLAMTERQLL